MENSAKSINMIDAVKLFFKNYVNFTGRASRSEYWWFMLAYFIAAFVIGFIEGFVMALMGIYSGVAIVGNIFILAMFIGLLSLNARRLQDRGHSGWWQAACYVPLIPMYIFLFQFIFSGGQDGVGGLILFALISIGTSITFIVFCCLPPKEDENKWGRNPLLPDTRITDQITD